MPERRYRSELTRTATTLLRVAINFQPGAAPNSLLLASSSVKARKIQLEPGILMFDAVRRPTGAAASLVHDGAIPPQMTGQERVPNFGETQSTDLGEYLLETGRDRRKPRPLPRHVATRRSRLKRSRRYHRPDLKKIIFWNAASESVKHAWDGTVIAALGLVRDEIRLEGVVRLVAPIAPTSIHFRDKTAEQVTEPEAGMNVGRMDGTFKQCPKCRRHTPKKYVYGGRRPELRRERWDVITVESAHRPALRRRLPSTAVNQSRFSHVAARRSEAGPRRSELTRPSLLNLDSVHPPLPGVGQQPTNVRLLERPSLGVYRITAHREIIPAVARDGLAGAWFEFLDMISLLIEYADMPLATVLDHANEAYVPVPVYTLSHVPTSGVRGSSHALQLSANWGSGDCITGIHCSQVKIVVPKVLYIKGFWAETTDAGGWLLAWSLYGVLNFYPHSTTNQTRAMARIRAAPNIITTASRTDTGEIRTSDESHQGRMREAGDQHAASSKFQPRKLLASRRGNRGAGAGTGTSAPSWRFPVCLLKSSTHFSPPRQHHAPRVACARTAGTLRKMELWPRGRDWRERIGTRLKTETPQNPLWQTSHSLVFLQITPRTTAASRLEQISDLRARLPAPLDGHKADGRKYPPLLCPQQFSSGERKFEVFPEKLPKQKSATSESLAPNRTGDLRESYSAEEFEVRFKVAEFELSSSLDGIGVSVKTVRRQHEEKNEGERKRESEKGEKTVKWLGPNRTGNLQDGISATIIEHRMWGSVRGAGGIRVQRDLESGGVTKRTQNSNRSLGHLGREPVLPNSCGRLASSESSVRRAQIIHGLLDAPSDARACDTPRGRNSALCSEKRRNLSAVGARRSWVLPMATMYIGAAVATREIPSLPSST
ncbi:hypothetical protein C8R46DRAFT_1041086 [Mycena filopes]|nr:hypothetical protein C8R46DRAFT_1041086 [Mycena filopes]